jgi:biotin operon repressor
MADAAIVEWIRTKYVALAPDLNERSRRRWAAVEASSLGWGGYSAVAAATGMSRNTIRKGMHELREGGTGRETEATGRIRCPGGGRKPLSQKDPGLLKELESLVEPVTRGDPVSPLRWTCKSTRKLAEELGRRNHAVSHNTVARLLRKSGYSLQSNRKTQEGTDHPDRNSQFEYINQQVKVFQKRGQPVISVDAKKKELVGNFKNGGREWKPSGQPEEVCVHDFPDPKLGKAIPYGVYDLTNNEAWVSVGIDHDTAEFSAEAIHRWWDKMGRQRFPNTKELYITSDGGGSNSSRSRLWKVALQKLADRTGLTLTMSHLPPGTSKWNKIEHRLFCHITQNWRGRPLISHEIIVKLIASTTTAAGLKVQAALDRGTYPTRKKVTDKELAEVHLRPAAFHGDWNYLIAPMQTSGHVIV